MRIAEATPEQLLDWDARTVDVPGGNVYQSRWPSSGAHRLAAALPRLRRWLPPPRSSGCGSWSAARAYFARRLSASWSSGPLVAHIGTLNTSRPRRGRGGQRHGDQAATGTLRGSGGRLPADREVNRRVTGWPPAGADGDDRPSVVRHDDASRGAERAGLRAWPRPRLALSATGSSDRGVLVDAAAPAPEPLYDLLVAALPPAVRPAPVDPS